MRLIELRSNKKSFHTITFNKTGLSIICAKKANKENADSKKTYNSVGKSLGIKLIHFCLGANPTEEFSEKLPGWEFSLDFIIGELHYTAIRSTDNQKVIVLNEKEYSLTKFREFIEEKVFKIDEPAKYLKFRPLISRFIRPKKSSYVKYDNFVNEEEDYPRLLNNAFLLGLDVNKIVRKYELKSSYDKISELKKNIDKDPILKSFFDGGKDIDIDIVDYEDKVKDLSEKIRKFIIADDYYKIKKDADEISGKLRDQRNKATLITNAIKNIENSIEIQPDISKEEIVRLYKEAQFIFNKKVTKQIEEVEAFNEKLLNDRYKRLSEEKKRLARDLKDFESNIKILGESVNEKLQYLNAYGALEEYTALNRQLSDYMIKMEKLSSYRDLINKYKNEQEIIKIELSKENIETNNFLIEAKSVLVENINLFKYFAQQFYDNKKAGIEVINDEGVNLQRFKVVAKIQDDVGDGVNEVKIFCFDWTLLKAKHNHNVEFIVHDSRLLSDMDPRQRTTVFKLAYENTKDCNFQYIISANEDSLESVKQIMTANEYESVIENNIILNLTDESDKTKLLGIEVDLDYEKD